MIELFALADVRIAKEQIKKWLKKEDDAEFSSLSDTLFATFLNGLMQTKLAYHTPVLQQLKRMRLKYSNGYNSCQVIRIPYLYQMISLIQHLVACVGKY